MPRLAPGTTHCPVRYVLGGSSPMGKVAGYEACYVISVLTPRLRMTGALPLLLYTIVLCMRVTLPFIVTFIYCLDLCIELMFQI